MTTVLGVSLFANWEKVWIDSEHLYQESEAGSKEKFLFVCCCKRGCECIAFDLIKHNVIVCLTCPPAECIAFENLCTIG